MVYLALVWALVGCSGLPAAPRPQQSTATARSLPAGLPDPRLVAQAYLDAWQVDDYPAMYGLLTNVSQAALTLEEFTRHYQGVARAAALVGVDYEILSVLTDPEKAQVRYRVVLTSSLAGQVARETVMNLSPDKDTWRVQWDDTLVLPELMGGNYLAMDRRGYVPARANIYDRDGQALVGQLDATAIGLYPDQIDPRQADALFADLEDLTGLDAETIQGLYAGFPAGQGWYLPLGQVSVEQIAGRLETLQGYSGLVLQQFKARYYLSGGIAPHVIGYVGTIPEEELDHYLRQGYLADELVGRAGLEQWGEPYLAGKRGGALYVLNEKGLPITRLSESASQPAQAIYTTIDRDFQLAVQTALSGFRGAVVVLERDTGRVLALVSSPAYDPNAFSPLTSQGGAQLAQIIQDPGLPLFNRATQGQYPAGSIFKTITMAAALESGRFEVEDTYQCGYTFNEIDGVTLYDWTYTYFQQDRKTGPSGLLTLPQGLMRSCNIWFYHIGLDLFDAGLPEQIPQMALGFGLGSPTGLQGLPEAAGQVNVPQTQVDATNLSIGQGDLLVTPLQVASFMAAIGNGGTLYTPQVIERIVSPSGEATLTFRPQERSTLPIRSSTLVALQDALVGVIRSTKPYGTAWDRFTGLDYKVAGKTGTATSGSDAPHAWFAGYTFEGRTDYPDIAIAVIIENGGEGSVYAAPVFRRVVELYFSGQAQRLYDWETTYNVTSTPTLPVPGTPVP